MRAVSQGIVALVCWQLECAGDPLTAGTAKWTTEASGDASRLVGTAPTSLGGGADDRPVRTSSLIINRLKTTVETLYQEEHQITRDPRGHILTNIGVWSPDSAWIVYDTRSAPDGAVFDGDTIEKVQVHTGEIKTLYRATNDAHCGAVTYHPRRNRVVFIHGPEHPTPDWQYGFYHREGWLVDEDQGLRPSALDARDVTPPFTPGALRGGSHVHVFSGDGEWLSYTYEDHVLAAFKDETGEHDVNLRNVGVSAPCGPVRVKHTHPRNQDGEYFSVLVTRTTANPKPGSDEIQKACEEGWIGTNGYVRADGTRQARALAFQGQVRTSAGAIVSEVFIVDLPEDVTAAGSSPLEGTATKRPAPPRGAVQRRLTFTADRPFPGLQGPRHWLRSSPDGRQIAFLMKDDHGVVQLWTVSPLGGAPRQVTQNAWDVASAFSWSPDGRWITYVMDNSIFVTEIPSGRSLRLTPRSTDGWAPRPEACVFSPDGRKIAYVRRVPSGGATWNQVFALFLNNLTPSAGGSVRP